MQSQQALNNNLSSTKFVANAYNQKMASDFVLSQFISAFDFF